MLVLSRRKLEVIHIGQEIVIKVLHVRNGTVRIGIEAPSSVRVLRGELMDNRPAPTVPATPLGAFIRAHASASAATARLPSLPIEHQRN